MSRANRSQASERVPDDAERRADEFHALLASLREQAEFMLTEKFDQVEAAFVEQLRDRDERIRAANVMIARLQDETARTSAALERIRQLARESG